MGSVIVILALNVLFHVLLMNVAHHRRDEIAVFFPVGVARVLEHGFFCGVFLVCEGDGSFGFG